VINWNFGMDPYAKPFDITDDFTDIVSLHLHPYAEALYCIEGALTTTIDESSYRVGAGQAIFINSGMLHEFRGFTAGTRVLWIGMGAEFLKKDFEALAKRNFSEPFMEKIPDKVQRLFDRILEEQKTPDRPGAEWIISGCLYDLAAFMLREMPGGEEKQKLERIRAMESVNKAIEHLSENYQREITVEEVSRLTGLGKSNFCRLFKLAMNTTFHQYLNEYRIYKACGLLLDTGKSISSIARETGFTEAKTFCKVFRKFAGMTPTEYRKDMENIAGCGQSAK